MYVEKPRGALIFSSSYTALAVARSLGRQGITVWALDNQRYPSGRSRYVLRTFPLPLDDAQLLSLLVNIANENKLKGWALFPDGDKSAAFIARYYKILAEYYLLTTPPSDILQWAVNKQLTYQLADEIGINYPKAFYPKERADVENLDGVFPMILKPIHHQGQDAFSNGRAWQANNRSELIALYDEMSKLAGPSVILIQEMIPNGPDTQFSYAALCKNGEVIADVFAERMRLTPPAFGVSAYVASIERPELEKPSKKWLKKLGYTGLVEIEYMLDKRDGLYKLLDVNTRVWGWIAMCTYTGVDFPFLMWKLMNGDDVVPVHGKAGVRWSRTIYDLLTSIELINSKNLLLGEYLLSMVGARHEVYALDDLKPGLAELKHFAGRGWRKLKKTISKRDIGDKV